MDKTPEGVVDLGALAAEKEAQSVETTMLSSVVAHLLSKVENERVVITKDDLAAAMRRPFTMYPHPADNEMVVVEFVAPLPAEETN